MPGFRVMNVRSWSHFQKTIAQPELTGWAFRGHGDASWPLESTLSRILRTYGVHRDLWPAQEARVNRIFRRKAHLFLTHIPPDEDDFQWLALMQHHGAPTRLLDFTWSPYVAAFFALERADASAAIWAICAPRLWNLRHTDPDTGRVMTTEELYLKTPGNYEKWYVHGSTPFVVQGEPFVMNQRLIAQSGTFVVPGVIDRPVEDIMSAYGNAPLLLLKLVIDARTLRDEFMYHLYSMNITNASLFPGLDGMARSLSYELEHHWAYNTKTREIHPSFRDT